MREKKEEEGVAAEGLLNFSFQDRRIDERVVGGGVFPARSHPRQFWRRVLVVALISLKEPGERRAVGTSKNLQQAGARNLCGRRGACWAPLSEVFCP